MYKSLAYKEWLKVKWFVLGGLLVEFTVTLALFIRLRAIIESNNANTVWGYIVFQQYMFFDQIKYIPLIIGIILGISQFYPEIQSMRLKLTLHLPLKENNTLLFMVLFGFAQLVGLYLFFLLILSAGSSLVFPAEIVNGMLLTSFPWFIAGIAGYFLVAVITVEPLWSRRIILSALGVIILDQLMGELKYGVYKYANAPLAVISIILCYLIILSGFRFKRGAK